MPGSSASVRIEAVAAVSPSSERAVVATVALATMLAPLNSTMIAVALPYVIAEFGAEIAGAGWLVTTYLIVMAALQPVAGKLGDRLGRRHLILGGVAWFGLVSLGTATASSLSTLLFFRVQQAIAGAMALPNGAALLREVVPAKRRAGRFGLVGAGVALAAAAGPALGGLLVAAAGWRAIFYVNLLFILPALAIGWWSIPITARREPGHPFDLAGAVLLSTGLVGMAILLSHGLQSDSRFGTTLGIALAVLATIFLWCELRHPDPILQPRFFGRQGFAAASAAIALSNLAMYATLLAIPILLLRRAGWRSMEVGFVLAAMSVGMVVFSPIGGRLADRLGRRAPTVAGLFVLTLGLAPLGLGGGGITTSALLVGLGLIGTGLGLSSAGLQTAAIEAVASQESGVASGVFSTSRYLGSIIGSSLLAGLLGTSGDGIAGFGAVFLMASAAALLAALASLGIQDQRG